MRALLTRLNNKLARPGKAPSVPMRYLYWIPKRGNRIEIETGTRWTSVTPKEPDDPHSIDLNVNAEDVARHLQQCHACRTGLERARIEGPAAMAVWRREFARCFARPLT
jgi:hypothetical protein